jgi:hypothetical protein
MSSRRPDDQKKRRRRHLMTMERAAALVAVAVLCGGMPPAAAKPCITIVTHEDDRLGFRNACDVCKRAVWSWGSGKSYFSREGKVEGVWQGGEPWTRKYQIPPRGEITVQEEWPTGKLLREDACTAPNR